MPIYQCYVPAGSLDADTRAELAEAITDIHCTVTVAPRGFAHVVFLRVVATDQRVRLRPTAAAIRSGLSISSPTM